MRYESLTPEQQARAEALYAATTCIGAPKNSFDDDLVRAANWVLTGDHPSLNADTTPQEGDGDDVADGGGPGSYAHAAAEHQAAAGFTPPAGPQLYDAVDTQLDRS